MDLSSLLGTAGVVLGLAGLAGAAFAVLRANVAKTTTDIWKGEAEAANARSTRLEKEHGECTARLNALEQKYDDLNERYGELKDIIDSALKAASPRMRKQG